MNTEKIYECYSVWAKGNALYARAANKMGVGYPEFVVLYALKVSGEQTQKEITDAFGLLKQTVHTVVRQLKQNGYVEIKPCMADKRERLVCLTQSGKEYADRIVEPIIGIENKVYHLIGDERIEQANEIMALFNLLFEKETERILGK